MTEEINEAAINTAKAAASVGAGGGTAVFAVSSVGIAGLSGPGIMTGLAGLGAVVGGGAAAGLFVTAGIALGTGVGVYKGLSWIRNRLRGD